MGFGTGNEVKDFKRSFYTGVENFKVIATSPTKGELEALWGRELGFELDYLGTQTVSDGDGEREVNQVRVDFYLSNEDVDRPISTKASFYLMNTHHKSQTGKLKCINSFGEDAWLTEDDIKNKTLPQNMQWYDNTGVRVAKRGEIELIDFLKSLLNIPFNNDKLVNKEDGHASLKPEDMEAIFKGDFSSLRAIVTSTNNKIGMALGVKTSTDGKLRQTVYGRKTLRQYSLHSSRADKFKWVEQHINETQASSALAQVDFGPSDLLLREYVVTPTKMTSDNAPDIFAEDTSAPDDLEF
jgi:hypothetical protein